MATAEEAAITLHSGTGADYGGINVLNFTVQQ
jgi:hypothetical protein